jgi:hypothetical protein
MHQIFYVFTRRCLATAPQLPCSAASVLTGPALLQTPLSCPQSRCPVTASNGGRSSSGVTSLQASDHLTLASYPHCRLQTLNCNSRLSEVPLYVLGTDRLENIVSNDSSIVAWVSVAVETMCVPSRYLAMDGCRDSTIIALTKSVTIFPGESSVEYNPLVDP